MRYYLIVPKTTFDLIRKMNSVTQTQDVQVEVLDQDGVPTGTLETVQRDVMTSEPNPQYNAALAAKLKRFSRIHSLDFDRINPKSIDGLNAIVEVEFEGSLYTEAELLNTHTQGRVDKCKDEDGNLVPHLVEEMKLDLYVSRSILTAYGHYPHINDGSDSCIHCYLKAHEGEWYSTEDMT